ncbi:MAG: hypothetical protein ABWY57_06980 [Mycetocola sp.]
MTERFLAVISSIGPPITLATALLLYFGWARTDAQAKAMGIDVSVFEYSAQDYALRSVTALYSPLIVLLVSGLLWNAADIVLRGSASRAPRQIATTGTTAIVAGFVVIVAAVSTEAIAPPAASLFAPYAMALGLLIVLWGFRLQRVATAGGGRRRIEGRAITWTLAFSLVALLLFWGTADFAQALGRRLASDYATTVERLPRTTVFSSFRLHIDAPGVDETRELAASTITYRYSGLRLLVLSGDRYILLNDGWTAETGTIVVLRDDQSVRFEFATADRAQ